MKQYILNILLKRVYNPVVTDDILTFDKGVLKIDGKEVKEDELRQLKAEEKAISGSRLWELMTKTTRHVAEKKIITESANKDQLTAGKTMIINLDTIESIARIIKSR